MDEAHGYHNLTFRQTNDGIKYSYINDQNEEQKDLSATWNVIGNSLAASDITQ
jgi:hypothetical protein